jgi:hypothetical protein
MEDTLARVGHGRRRLCGAAKRQGDGSPCKKPAGWGTPHPGTGRCRLHGGSTRSQSKGAADAAVEERARAMLAQLDAGPVDNPLAELQHLAGRVLAWERAIGQMVNDLVSLRYETEFGEQLRSEVALLERAMDRCERVLVAMARLNIDERLARLSQAQAALVTGVILGAFADVGLSQELQDAVRPAIGRRLRLVAAEERERERNALDPA